MLKSDRADHWSWLLSGYARKFGSFGPICHYWLLFASVGPVLCQDRFRKFRVFSGYQWFLETRRPGNPETGHNITLDVLEPIGVTGSFHSFPTRFRRFCRLSLLRGFRETGHQFPSFLDSAGFCWLPLWRNPWKLKLQTTATKGAPGSLGGDVRSLRQLVHILARIQENVIISKVIENSTWGTIITWKTSKK